LGGTPTIFVPFAITPCSLQDLLDFKGRDGRRAQEAQLDSAKVLEASSLWTKMLNPSSSSTEKPEGADNDQSSHAKSSMLNPDRAESLASEMRVADGNELTPFLWNRSKGPRCGLYPLCNARPCRLSSHQHYTRQQRLSASRNRNPNAKAVCDRPIQAPMLNSPLARIVNPRMDPFIRYPFELTAEMHEMIYLGQSLLNFQPLRGYECPAWWLHS
jgi:hypothetical protein